MVKALEIKNLSKTYLADKGSDGKLAVDDVSLEIEKGDMFALLGPNGAGKSTIINCIVGLIDITGGSIKILGHDSVSEYVDAKLSVGIVPQEFNFSIFEKVIDIVVTQAGYYGVPRKLATERAENILKDLDLYEKKDVQSKNLSGGMKRRLMIARALVHHPKLLILDEPSAGVDVELRKSMWSYLRKLNKEHGVTIILTTHYLEEGQELCNKVAFINKGKIVEQGNMESILNKYNNRKLEDIYLELIKS